MPEWPRSLHIGTGSVPGATECHVMKWHMGVLVSGAMQVSVVLLDLSERELENAVERN